MKGVVFLGGGGHSVAVFDVLIRDFSSLKVLGVVDPNPKCQLSQLGIEWLGPEELSFLKGVQDVSLVSGIGHLGNADKRHQLFIELNKTCEFLTVISSKATVSPTASIGRGATIFPNAVVGANVRVGDNSIINTSAVIEHGSLIGNNVHISTAAVVNGDCRIKDGAFVGSGAVILQGAEIQQNGFVAALSLIKTGDERVSQR